MVKPVLKSTPKSHPDTARQWFIRYCTPTHFRTKAGLVVYNCGLVDDSCLIPGDAWTELSAQFAAPRRRGHARLRTEIVNAGPLTEREVFRRLACDPK